MPKTLFRQVGLLILFFQSLLFSIILTLVQQSRINRKNGEYQRNMFFHKNLAPSVLGSLCLSSVLLEELSGFCLKIVS